MLGVHFAAADEMRSMPCTREAKSFGASVADEPKDLPTIDGGGYGFQFRTPEGHVLNVSSNVAAHS